MTAKEWSLIKSKTKGANTSMLYQVYLTKYKDLEEVEFKNLITIWCTFNGGSVGQLCNNIYNKYEKQFRSEGKPGSD